MMIWTVRVLLCFLLDGHCDQLRYCQLLRFNWTASGPHFPSFFPFSFFFFNMSYCTLNNGIDYIRSCICQPQR